MQQTKAQKQLINVFVRQRPVLQREPGRIITKIPNPKEIIVQHSPPRCYQFDGVFGPKVNQKEIYYEVVAPLVEQMLDGYNCTIFAYGQTGTGKTYTIAGKPSDNNWEEDTDAGLIPRTGNHIFKELEKQKLEEHCVSVSFVELYNEELKDLLYEGNTPPQLKMYEDVRQKGTVIIQNLSEVAVSSPIDIYNLLQKGMEKRQTAATLINDQSSRSHSVFTISVHLKEQLPNGTITVKSGKINLVDLAGSENVNRSGAVNMRAREAGNINQSLLTLGRVITALVNHQAHIPYRGSKLTRILQDSLGGRTKTSIIATVSPTSVCLDETISTLDYANRARNISNSPEANLRFSKAQVIEMYIRDIEEAKRDLAALRTSSGFYIDKDNYESLLSDSEKINDEVLSREESIRRLEEHLVELTERLKMEEQRWEELMQKFDFFKSKAEEYSKRVQKEKVKVKAKKKIAKLTAEVGKEQYDVNKIMVGAIEKAASYVKKFHSDIEMIYEHSNEQIAKKKEVLEMQNEVFKLEEAMQVKMEGEIVGKFSKVGSGLDVKEYADEVNARQSLSSAANDISSQGAYDFSEIINIGENYKKVVTSDINSIASSFKEVSSKLERECLESDKKYLNTHGKAVRTLQQEVSKQYEHLNSIIELLDKTAEDQLEEFDLIQELADVALNDVHLDIKRSYVLINQLQKRIAIKEKSEQVFKDIKKDFANAGDDFMKQIINPAKIQFEGLKKQTAETLKQLNENDFKGHLEKRHKALSDFVKAQTAKIQDLQTHLTNEVDAVADLCTQASKNITEGVHIMATTKNDIVQNNFSALESILSDVHNVGAEITLLLQTDSNIKAKVKHIETLTALPSDRIDHLFTVDKIRDGLKCEPSNTTPKKSDYPIPDKVTDPLKVASTLMMNRCNSPMLDVSLNNLDVSMNFNGDDAADEVIQNALKDISMDESLTDGN